MHGVANDVWYVEHKLWLHFRIKYLIRKWLETFTIISAHDLKWMAYLNIMI